MKKLIVIAVATVAVFATGTAQAGIFGRRNCRPTYAVPVAVAPAPVTTTTAGTGYRTYSYEPSVEYPAYSYQPAARMAPRNYNRMPTGGFHDAGWKIRGGF